MEVILLVIIFYCGVRYLGECIKEKNKKKRVRL